MTAATLGFLGLAVTANPVVIYGLMMLMGATTAAYLVAWMPLVAEAGGNRPNRSMTLASFVLNTVAVLMLLIGGQWIGPGTYRIAVTTFGALSGLCVLAFFVTSRRLEHLLADESDPARPIVSDPRSTSILNLSRTEIMALARGPLPMVVLFGTCAAPFCFHTSNQLFPNLARDVHGFSEQAIATLVGLGRIPSLVTMLTMSFIIDRLNPIRAYGVGVLLDGIVIVVLALASRAGTLCAAYLLFYFVHGIVWGAGLPSVSACVRPERRAPAFAIGLMVEIVTISLVGLIHNRLLAWGASLNTVFLVCALAAGFAGGTLYLYSFTSHSKRTQA